MIINATQTVSALAASTRSQATAVKTATSSPNVTDQVSFSDAARMLQQNDAWQAALTSRQNGIPKLIPVRDAQLLNLNQ